MLTDEAGNQWKQTADGLGRLTQVLEPSSTSQTPSIETDYGYGSLQVNVTQKGVAGQDSPRPRTFTSDTLGRKVSSSTPEAGIIAYTYDSNGNLVSVKDARSLATTLSYDTLNRLTDKTFTDGTPGQHFQYDQTSSWMGQMYYTAGGGGGGGGSSASDSAQTVIAKVCGALPSGAVSSISGNGNFAGTAGSLDVVTNFRTGETTGFFSPGYFAGAATVGGSVTTGYTFGDLGSGNSNFTGGFSAVSVGYGYLTGSVATSSGGPASPTSGINPTGAGHVTVVAAGVQTPGRALSVNSTFSLPLGGVGKFLTAVSNLANPFLKAATQACAAAGH